ncbi:DNA recombination protein RmuC [Stenotrophobium rhamnosiphilum]|uniref:DNA recombination protein RmuC n=1 Tax=Stenotrophobium rhamnosiphilum TaxID=2029166 RepID=A0A2T5MGE4_9GAMM|nr:DNA recombination protein RmuC [Stenotrophobium rhamnosiphilum]PTU31647.1 DNA recombination protein RmuC [Stenotrophobium rhamnosiphilum]
MNYSPLILAGTALVLLLQLTLLWRGRRKADDGAAEKIDALLRGETTRLRSEIGEMNRQQRQELGANLEAIRQLLDERFKGFLEDARGGRRETAEGLQRFAGSLTQQLSALTESNAQRMNEMRVTLEGKLKDIQADNAAKLEEMRKTVDEKLHATLEQRLGESFKLVSDRLEQVHKGLGEMQTLAAGVGDLKRVLTNVKTRGGWGEVQLESILEQIFTAEQFAKQVAVNPDSRDMVDCAVRMPGRSNDETPCWLPIDAKFPSEDYERLLDAQERADIEAIKTAGSQLERAVRIQAKSISEKYIAPPNTTDFAVMFLPTEGLYAEVIRRPNMVDSLQREFRVVLAGPTTLIALLNSLQMGFRTLAIAKRSSEVWKVLGAVKTEFGKFGDVLDKVQDKLKQASNTIGDAGVRSRAIERQLRNVEALSADTTEPLLKLPVPPNSQDES